MDVMSYLLGKKAGGGSQPPNLEEKSVTITTNTTTTVSPDEGYDGLESVEVTTNVVSNYNVKMEGTYLGNQMENCAALITEADVAGFSETNMRQFFKNLRSLTTIKNLDTSSAEDMSGFFAGCASLETIPSIDTSHVKSINKMCQGCAVLKNVPTFNLSSIEDSSSSLQSVFSACPNLTDDSLNNIMASCLTATSYNQTKSLYYLGLSPTQATTCMTLSNYAAFTAAGWTTGY